MCAFPSWHRLANITDTTNGWIFVVGISRIPKAHADKLPNKTIADPNDDRFSVMALDVFHQLHCLVRTFTLKHYGSRPSLTTVHSHRTWYEKHSIRTVTASWRSEQATTATRPLTTSITASTPSASRSCAPPTSPSTHSCLMRISTRPCRG